MIVGYAHMEVLDATPIVHSQIQCLLATITNSLSLPQFLLEYPTIRMSSIGLHHEVA